MEYESLSADEIKVRLYGDTAIVTYRSNAKGKDQQGEIDFPALSNPRVPSSGRALAASPLAGDTHPVAVAQPAVPCRLEVVRYQRLESVSLSAMASLLFGSSEDRDGVGYWWQIRGCE